MALVLIRGENNSKILNAIADVERHANLNLTTKPKKIDAKYADKIVENILKAPLRTKSNSNKGRHCNCNCSNQKDPSPCSYCCNQQ